jgi:hypothetical protein
MTSAINTNGINVNYPVPGVNNNSQGFRDNFATIRTNLNTASTEITDLQNNVVVKSALANTSINNDMANTLISNALTRSFRASTYNLGNNISNTIVINASLGDVQYGTISGNTTIQFAGWAPSGTQSNLQLELNISNANAVISFPPQVSMTGSYGVETLENFANIANVPTVSIPYGVSQLEYRLSTIDCGNSITIEPFNRPRITSQVQQRTPAPTGFQGDVAGDIAVNANYVYVCTGSFDSTVVTKSVSATYSGNLIYCGSNNSLELNAPIIFTGNTWGNIVANTVYYIKSIPDSANITISATGFDGTAGVTFAVSALSPANTTMTATSYNGTAIWKSIALAGSSNAAQTITGNLTVGGFLAVSCDDNITAAGTVQANATLLTNNINIVQTASVNTGVKLPIAMAGYRIVIRNNNANTVRVYPNTGASINSGTIDTAVTLGNSAAIEYFCSTSAVANVGGAWYTLNSTYV